MDNLNPKDIGLSFKKNRLRFLALSFLVLLSTAVFVPPCYGAGMRPDREQEVRDRLERILSSKEFTRPQEGKSILEKIGEMINDFIEKIKEIVPKGKSGGYGELAGGGAPSAGLALKIFSAAIIVVFIFMLMFFIVKNFYSSGRIKRKEDAELLTMMKDSSEVEQTAMELYFKGDFRQALRFLYIAFLLRLNKLNVIKIDKSKTNKQYLKEMADNGYNRYDTAQKFTRDFNKFWYGNKSVGKARFDYWYSEYTSMIKGGVL